MTDGNEPIDDTGSASTDRRNFLKAAGVAGASAVAVAGASHGKFGLAPITAAQAETSAMPKLTDKPWWPSKWGADDQAGASNHITPAKVLDSVKWIKDGKIHKLGHTYDFKHASVREAGIYVAHPRQPDRRSVW